MANLTNPLKPKTALLKSGGTMSGNINMAGHKVTGLPIPTADSDAATLEYTNSLFAWKTLRSDPIGNPNGYLSISYNEITGLISFAGSAINTPTFGRVDKNPLIVPGITLPEILRPNIIFYIQDVGPVRGLENATSIELDPDGTVKIGGQSDVSSTGFNAQKVLCIKSFSDYFPNFPK